MYTTNLWACNGTLIIVFIFLSRQNIAETHDCSFLQTHARVYMYTIYAIISQCTRCVVYPLLCIVFHRKLNFVCARGDTVVGSRDTIVMVTGSCVNKHRQPCFTGVFSLITSGSRASIDLVCAPIYTHRFIRIYFHLSHYHHSTCIRLLNFTTFGIFKNTV
jgi:hypothetical protein